MAIQDPSLEAYESLGYDINKVEGEEGLTQGIVTEKLPELKLTMKDEELIKLTTKWEKKWKDSASKRKWEQKGKENEKYWLGLQYDSPKADKDRPMVDNLIFESLETFLPQATRRNPEPLVMIDNSEEESDVTKKYKFKVRDALADIADKNKLRLKLKRSVRHWALYLLGIAKFGWDLDKDIPTVKIIRPQKIILDPNSIIDEDGYNGQYIGEYRKMEASKLLDIIDEGAGATKIRELTEGKLSTEIQFIEWWTKEYMCWTLDNVVLLKRKNPHWNYDETEEDFVVDDYGNETSTTKEIKGINHLPTPDMPYRFLTVFNLGDQPMDNTSLIGQNLANQDLINKRNRQIDKNADSMNGGIIVSLERAGLTKEQASSVERAIRKGGTVAIPTGSPREAIDRINATGLPADIFNQLADTRLRLRDVFGVRGSSPAGTSTEKTVRGKFQQQSLDTDRIGGGVTEYLEQFADDIYNWWVQLLYVYDTRFQFIGNAEPPKMVISVKEGSLLPKDSITLANQAMELAGAGKMSLIDLYKRLEYSNPEELAANAWLEANAPEMLYKDERIAQVMANRQEPPEEPNQSINFKDLPPAGKTQLAAKAGIRIQPQEALADEVIKETIEDTKLDKE